ncbi:SAM-dependent methyltransferase [Paracandidimonas soli]|uniref:SAM-dependent methyltransferase n=1 Tax=Paracandidimonas soli TaxID=1917182 RepID=UPI00333EB5B0
MNDQTQAKPAGSSGSLHLIPVSLGEAPSSLWLPEDVRRLAAGLTIYIAENAKTARAFLKSIQAATPLREITIHTLDARTDAREIREWLQPLRQGADIGLVSEAGCPAVADPGAKVVSVAHALGLPVRPWTGPSSILLGLMASGLDGQRFAFHGYAPVEPNARAAQLRTWENESRKHNQTQIFIETPYRNTAMLQTLLQALKSTTRLCIARGLTTPDEFVRTLTVAEWKNAAHPDLSKIPTVFLFLAT